MAEYERVGVGRYDIYRKKKTSLVEIIAGLAFWIILLLVIGSLIG